MFHRLPAIGQGAVIWGLFPKIFPNELRAYGANLGKSFTHMDIKRPLLPMYFPFLPINRPGHNLVSLP